MSSSSKSPDEPKQYETTADAINHLRENLNVFHRFTYTQVVENDTQYDLQNLEQAYKKIAPKGASLNPLYHEIRRITKPETFDD